MSATKKLSAGVYQVIGTDWCVMNDSHKCWWVCKVVDGTYSLELHEMLFIGGTRNDAIQYAKELQVQL